MTASRHVFSLSLILFLLLVARVLHAGGPAYVAGVSYFNSGTAGTPVTWANGSISYYTDQGDLSPVLPHASADSFVASAFDLWTSIPTAAVSASQAGQLAEDVSGTNVYVNSDGSISIPADILPSAIGTPVGIVYDEDGAVTDALLGEGASDSAYCLTNAVFGGPDNFSTDAHFAHALVVINGNCAQTSAQLPDLQYHLIRVLGRVLGLGWSQTNVNVDTGKPPATSADYAGFPVMHSLDPSFCTPISKCYPNADQPKMDDEAALSRIYPVTSQNQSSFPGKTIFAANTARIHGTVYFADANGQPTQPMQGVNVVARWIDPSTGQPSRTYVSSCVSGFLFRGNAGNPATGYTDSTGQRFDRFGSDDPALEGFFDLAGLQIPNGASSAQYQITAERIDPTWSEQVGPYAPSQVEPSGTAQPITVTVTRGGDVQQDIVMLGSAIAQPDSFGPTTYAKPVPVLASGEWNGSLNGYGDSDYFSFSGQANRTLSVEVTALDESGTASQNKAEPVIGMWALSDPGTFPAPANSPAPFNTSTLGLTQLNAVFNQATSFRLGIFDLRGDGRPDYRYRARVFYGDSLSPARASVAGGSLVTIQGLGFHNNVKAAIAGTNATVLSQTANQVLVTTPARPDGVQSIVLSDPATGASSTMSGVLTFGAGPSDTIKLISGANPTTPVGGQAVNPVIVEAVASDGVTPVSGATVMFSSSPVLSFAACNGATTCTVITDANGRASSYMTPLTPGVNTITASLAPASYNPAQQVQTTLYAESAALDLSLSPSRVWAAQGTTLSIPITAKVLANGAPVSGQNVTFSLSKGMGTLTPASATSDSSGNATTTLQVTNLSSEVDGSACVTSGGTTNCQNFATFAVAPSELQVQAVSGATQEIRVGKTFEPVAIRVTDSSSPPNPVSGAAVAFQLVIGRALNNEPVIWIGDLGITQNPMPVILGSAQSTIITDANGLAALQPSTNGIQGPLLILGTATVGGSSQRFTLQSLP